MTDHAPSVEPTDDPVLVRDVARGIATAVAPDGGLADIQATLLGAVTEALTDQTIDYRTLEPLDADGLADRIGDRGLDYRQRIVHHMVLGELVLRPLPLEVGIRVAEYAKALGVEDRFVRVARRYAQGAFGLAWKDLKRSGFTENWESVKLDQLRTASDIDDPFGRSDEDHELAERWRAFEHLGRGTLGRRVWEMYHGRKFSLPGTADGASAYLAQHDFVHVLADYGTDLRGEIEVFAFIGRADPDPKGFAWLATVIGLFETGYIASTGFFDSDTKEPAVQAPGMTTRLADAVRRGKHVASTVNCDLFEIDYHELAAIPVAEVRRMLDIPEKSPRAIEAGSVGAFALDGMSATQRAAATRATMMAPELRYLLEDQGGDTGTDGSGNRTTAGA